MLLLLKLRFLQLFGKMKIFLTLLRYIPSLILSVISVLATWLLAPLLALCYTKDVQGREWLITPLRWFQTHDNPVDEWRVGNYCKNCHWVNWDFTKPFHRYLARYFWLCRNPAYGFAQLLGVVPRGEMLTHFSVGTWDSATTNYHLTTWDNCFQYRAQLYFYKTHYLRLNLGWKGHAGFTKYMLASHISPFRTWKTGA